jgi:hypothetical protein
MVSYDSFYTTVQNIQDELRVDTPFSANTNPSLQAIENWIYEESSAVDELTGFIAAETVRTEYIDYSGAGSILLKHSPIISISSLSHNTNPLGSSLGEAWITKTQDIDYTIYGDKGKILLITSNFTPYEGPKRFKIIYTSGYAIVPFQIQRLTTKLVALRVLNSLVHSNINDSNDGGSISVGSINITEPASYGVNSYKQLKADIDQLKQEVARGTGVYRYTTW